MRTSGNGIINRMLRFLALGDSYTIGEAVAENERWPVQLVARLRELDVDIADPEIIATNGWTTDELAAGITAAQPEGPYDLVSLLIGVNNQYRGWSQVTYRHEFTDLLQQAIALANNDPQRVIVLSIPDWSVVPFAAQDERSRTQIAREIDAFNDVNRQEAERCLVHYVDITPGSRAAAEDSSLIADDKLHPSGKMYAQWAQLMEPIACPREFNIACIGGAYLDLKIHNLQDHKIDFTKEKQVKISVSPGGSAYYVSKYLNKLEERPLLISAVGRGNRGLANVFFEMANNPLRENQKIGVKEASVTNLNTALTVVFVQEGKQAMYTDPGSLNELDWSHVKKIIDLHLEINGNIFISSYFKTKLYSGLAQNLKLLKEDRNFRVFLDHGRVQEDNRELSLAKANALLDALEYVDIYLGTKEELCQFMDICLKGGSDRQKQLPKLIESFLQAKHRMFPACMILHDGSKHHVGLRRSDGDYEWKNIDIHPVREDERHVVGGSSVFDAVFIKEFLQVKGALNDIEILIQFMQKAQYCMGESISGTSLPKAYHRYNPNLNRSRSIPPVQDLSDRAKFHLKEVLRKKFSKDEIRSLCFDLTIEFDEIGGNEGTKTTLAIELIEYCERHGDLLELYECVKTERPADFA
ncbi:MAG: hypothetical protein GY796_30980 [Chloroflexi bacterium]|nr:hypothetical protein [Chloroflexota bacterium]